MTTTSKPNGKEAPYVNKVRALLDEVKEMDLDELKDCVRTLAKEAGVDVEEIEERQAKKAARVAKARKSTPDLKGDDKADFLSMFQVANEDLTESHKDLLATMIMLDTYNDLTLCRLFATVAKARGKVEEFAMNTLQLGADGDIGVGIFQTCEHGRARAMTSGEGMDEFIEDMMKGKIKIEKEQAYDREESN